MPGFLLHMLRRPSLTVAALVLAVLLAGSATAAKLITGKDVRNSSLTGADVRDRSLTTSDLSTAARAALRGARGPAGPAGPAGAQGPAGPAGATGPRGRTVVRMARAPDPVPVTTGETTVAELELPTGTWVVTALTQAFLPVVGDRVAGCKLVTAPSTEIANGQAYLPTQGAVASLVLHTSVVVDAAPVTVRLRCGDGGDELEYLRSSITATLVDELVVTP